MLLSSLRLVFSLLPYLDMCACIMKSDIQVCHISCFFQALIKFLSKIKFWLFNNLYSDLSVFIAFKLYFSFLIFYVVLRLILSLRALTSTPPSPVTSSRSSTWISSVEPWSQWRGRSVTLGLTSKRLMTSFWLEDPRGSPRSRSSFKTSLMERSCTKASTLMRCGLWSW